MIAAVADFHILDRELVLYRVHGGNQFGNHRFGFREQIALARWQIAERIFSNAERLYGALEARLESESNSAWSSSEATLAVIRAKIAHARARDRMPAGFFARLPVIARETLNRGYWRYSYGAKSVAQDLFLR